MSPRDAADPAITAISEVAFRSRILRVEILFGPVGGSVFAQGPYLWQPNSGKQRPKQEKHAHRIDLALISAL